MVVWGLDDGWMMDDVWRVFWSEKEVRNGLEMAAAAAVAGCGGGGWLQRQRWPAVGSGVVCGLVCVCVGVWVCVGF